MVLSSSSREGGKSVERKPPSALQGFIVVVVVVVQQWAARVGIGKLSGMGSTDLGCCTGRAIPARDVGVVSFISRSGSLGATLKGVLRGFCPKAGDLDQDQEGKRGVGVWVPLRQTLTGAGAGDHGVPGQRRGSDREGDRAVPRALSLSLSKGGGRRLFLLICFGIFFSGSFFTGRITAAPR